MKSRALEKWIVGYFSFIGFFLFSAFMIGPRLGPILITIIYGYILYKWWGNRKLIIAMALVALISFNVLGIVFAFTFPIWIIFGPICLIYGFATGLMNKTSNSSVVDTTSPSRKKPLVKLILGLIILIGCFYLISIRVMNGSWSSCNYTEEVLPISANLQNSTFTLEKNEYVVRGSDPDNCSQLLEPINNQLIPTTWATEYAYSFETNGRVVEELEVGKRFMLDKSISVTKHGLSAVDSGPGPMTYLILRDEKGELYVVSTVWLGRGDENVSLIYFEDGNKKYLP